MNCEICGMDTQPNPAGEYYAHLTGTCIANLKAQLAQAQADLLAANKIIEELAKKLGQEHDALLVQGAAETALREALGLLLEMVSGERAYLFRTWQETFAWEDEVVSQAKAAVALTPSEAAERVQRLVEVAVRVVREQGSYKARVPDPVTGEQIFRVTLKNTMDELELALAVWQRAEQVEKERDNAERYYVTALGMLDRVEDQLKQAQADVQGQEPL